MIRLERWHVNKKRYVLSAMKERVVSYQDGEWRQLRRDARRNPGAGRGVWFGKDHYSPVNTAAATDGVAAEMTPVVLRMVMAALADRTTQVTEVAQHLGLHRTTLYPYVHGDGSLKARGQALLTSWGETVRTAGPCHPQ